MATKHDVTSTEVTLVKRTLRTVALLVGACVLFVGALSVVAVSIASRAVGMPGGSGAHATDSNEHVKKPLSI